MADIPPEVLALLKRLWQIQKPLLFQLRPRDAWVLLGIIQFATRNPALNDTQRALVVGFGRQIQAALAAIDPAADPYLEMGWNPEHDV